VFYVYILYSASCDRFYIGHTNDVERRMEEHNHPVEDTKFTSKYLPWELKLSFPVSSERGAAIHVEKFIKSQKSKVFIKTLIAEKDNKAYFTTLIINVLQKKLVRAIPRTRD
jgi:putative endonuclease